MTQSLYRLLLRFYPRQVREEFGDEMLAVFNAATHDGGGLWFLLRECGGMIRGAAHERSISPRWASAVAGLSVAFVSNWILYSFFDRQVQRVSRVVQGASVEDDQLALGIMALSALLLMVPLIVLACRETQRSVDRKRFRPVKY